MTTIEVFHYTWIAIDWQIGEGVLRQSTRKVTRAKFEERKAVGQGKAYRLLDHTRELVSLSQVVDGVDIRSPQEGGQN